jgi:hypothetical protein
MAKKLNLADLKKVASTTIVKRKADDIIFVDKVEENAEVPLIGLVTLGSGKTPSGRQRYYLTDALGRGHRAFSSFEEVPVGKVIKGMFTQLPQSVKDGKVQQSYILNAEWEETTLA